MLCPECKSPIEENATVCEWCGVNYLDIELIALLEKDDNSDDTTGYEEALNKLYEYLECTEYADFEKAGEYIERLNFFRKHKSATEEDYRKKIEEDKIDIKRSNRILIAAIPFIFSIPGMLIGIALNIFGNKDTANTGQIICVLSWICFMLCGSYMLSRINRKYKKT